MKTAKDDLSCNGCDYKSLPVSSGFCYMLKEKPETCFCYTTDKNPSKAITPLETEPILGEKL
jgi:hypothetical protein